MQNQCLPCFKCSSAFAIIPHGNFNSLIDLVLFLCIFLFFLLSFGIMYQANLFPNSPPSWYLLKSILYMPYWQMYGELFLDQLEGESPDTCTNNESIWRPAGGRNRCPENNALVPLLGAVYILLTHILLVNLLIAMLSYTIQMVQKRSESVWRLHRYSLVHEFYYRPKLCPPFIILSHINRSMLYVKRTCSGQEYTDEFKLNLNEKYYNRLTLFVRSATNQYLSTSQKTQIEELGTKIAETSDRVERVLEEISSIKEHVKFIRSSIVDENRPDTAEPLLNVTSDNSSHTPLTPGIKTDKPYSSESLLHTSQTSRIKTDKPYSSEPCLHYTSDNISHTSKKSRIKTDKPYSSEPCLHYTSDNISHTSKKSRLYECRIVYMPRHSDTDTDTETSLDVDTLIGALFSKKERVVNDNNDALVDMSPTQLTPGSSNEEKEQLNDLGEQVLQTTRL